MAVSFTRPILQTCVDHYEYARPVRHQCPRTAETVAVIGCGTQAENQLWALRAVRTVRDIRVHSRSAARRAAFADDLAERWGLPIRAVDSATEAVTGAEIVLLATTSGRPVINSGDLEDTAFVSTLGPKQVGRAEFDLDLAESASLLVTDSITQIGAYRPPNLLHGSTHEQRLRELGTLVLAGGHPRPSGRTVFFSVGLAGTEAHLLATLLGIQPLGP